MVVIRMKISKFAEVNNVSVDTIRHYMDLGLVIPEKKEVTIFLTSIVKRI